MSIGLEAMKEPTYNKHSGTLSRINNLIMITKLYKKTGHIPEFLLPSIEELDQLRHDANKAFKTFEKTLVKKYGK